MGGPWVTLGRLEGPFPGMLGREELRALHHVWLPRPTARVTLLRLLGALNRLPE